MCWGRNSLVFLLVFVVQLGGGDPSSLIAIVGLMVPACGSGPGCCGWGFVVGGPCCCGGGAGGLGVGVVAVGSAPGGGSHMALGLVGSGSGGPLGPCTGGGTVFLVGIVGVVGIVGRGGDDFLVCSWLGLGVGLFHWCSGSFLGCFRRWMVWVWQLD